MDGYLGYELHTRHDIMTVNRRDDLFCFLFHFLSDKLVTTNTGFKNRLTTMEHERLDWDKRSRMSFFFVCLFSSFRFNIWV